MSITIYSLGDHESIRAALVGVAMVFDPSKELLGGTGVLGIGQFAGFGLLITFAFVMMNVVIKQKLELAHVLIVGVMYTVLFVPKTSVNIEDMHTGQVAVVDNVPIGVAYPGGIISSFTRTVAVTMEQVMRDSSSEYIPQTDIGFAAPLKLLLSVRGSVAGDPYFKKNYSYFMTDCYIPGADAKQAGNMIDLREVFVAGAVGALSGAATLYSTPSNNEGELLACTEVASKLEVDYENLISGTDPSVSSSIPMSTFEARVNAVMDRKPGALGMAKYSQADVAQMIETFGGVGVNSQKVIAALVLGDLTYQTFNCGVTCSTSMTQALEQYKTDATGQASMFQKTMIPSMNIFMFFFFAFSPLIAIIVAMSGMKGIVQIVPKYLLFGVWTQSWIPAAAVINYFIQMQTRDEISGRIMMGDGVPLANVMQLYHLLTLKIAAASELLAAAPLVTMALISGSVYGLTQLASRGTEKFDEKIATPDALKVDATSQTAARNVMAPDLTTAGMTEVSGPSGQHRTGAQSTWQSSMTQEAGNSVVSGKALALEQANQQVMDLSSTMGSDFGRQAVGSKTFANGNSATSSLQQGHGRAFTFAQGVGSTMRDSFSELESKELNANINKMAEVAGGALLAGAQKGFAGAALKNFVGTAVKAFAKDGLAKTASGAIPTAQMTEAFRAAAEKAVSQQFNSGDETTDNWAAGYSTANMSKDEIAFAEQVSQGFRSGQTETLKQAKSNVAKATSSLQEAQSLQKRATNGHTFNEKTAGAVGGTSAAFTNWSDGTVKQEGLGAKVAAKDARLKAQGHFSGDGEADNRMRHAAASAMVLSENGFGAEVATRLSAAASGNENIGSVPGEQVAKEADLLRAEVGTPGLAKNESARVSSAAANAIVAASTAGGNTQGIPQELDQIRSGASNTVGPDSFEANKQQVDAAAAGSGIGASNSVSATNMQPTAEFQSGSQLMKDEFKKNHGFSDLVGKFGKDMMDSPAVAALAAVGGTAAVASALSTIAGHHVSGLGGKGMSLGQYGAKVMGRLAGKLPGMAARHGVATVAGAGAFGVGAAVLNAGALVMDGVEVVRAVKEVMNDVDKGVSDVGAGLSSAKPAEYISNTISGQGSAGVIQPGGQQAGPAAGQPQPDRQPSRKHE